MSSKTIKSTAKDATKFGASTSFDQQIWNDTEAIINKGSLTHREVIEHFPLFLRRVNFSKFIAHVEIFKHTVDLPGCIVECGVFHGVSFLTFLKLVETYCPGDSLKRLVGFDTFQGFPKISEKDGAPNERYGKVADGWDSADFYPYLKEVIDLSQRDSLIPRVKRVELVQGDANKTIPEYVAKNPGLRIALLHLDMDLYEPTMTALVHLYPLVVSGGVVLFDEYGMDGFPGESRAFDEYFKDKRPVLKKFPFIPTPGGYFIKDS